LVAAAPLLVHGMVNDTVLGEMVLLESETPMSAMKPSSSRILMGTFQMGWKISEQFSASTCAASLTQLMASLMCLQLHRMNSS